MLSKMPDKLDNLIVCDYGSGTGILGIAAILKGASKVTAIEKNFSFIEIMKHNFYENSVSEKIYIVTSSENISTSEVFDYIFCNPACYPSVVGSDSFFYAGDLGIDMIDEVILFASKRLEKKGHLLILIPSISPISLVFRHLKNLGLCWRVVDSKYVALRKHLCDKIKLFVDKNSKVYPEMCYFEKNGEFFERVDLYDIFF